jgi:L-glyceraldehyde 3-phosphate reductase
MGHATSNSYAQLNDNIGALNNLQFTTDELLEIDSFAVEAEINLWKT